jgi:hypothetical protein
LTKLAPATHAPARSRATEGWFSSYSWRVGSRCQQGWTVIASWRVVEVDSGRGVGAEKGLPRASNSAERKARVGRG